MTCRSSRAVSHTARRILYYFDWLSVDDRRMMACPSLVISRSMRTDDPSSIELQERVKTLEKRMDSKSPPHLYLHDVYTHIRVAVYLCARVAFTDT